MKIKSLAGTSTLLLLAILIGTFVGRTVSFSLYDIITKMRFSRVLVALSSGACLGAAGVVFQSVFRNPMAEPYLLGASSGASFAVAVFTLLASVYSFSAYGFYPAAALLGAAAATFVTLFLSHSNRRTPALKLLLTGLAVSFFLGAMTPVILAFSGRDLYTVFFFLNGTTQGKGFSEALLFLLLTIAGILALAFKSRSLDYLMLGEERSYHIGFETEKQRLLMLVIASYLTGLSVAFSGIVGFVGLLIPNLTRKKLADGALEWIIASALTGATFLVLSDFAARNLFFPREVPLNSITALIGAPYLIALVRKDA